MKNNFLLIEKLLRNILKEEKMLHENNNIDVILDKINKTGLESLTNDEKKYLRQHNNNSINKDFESWLFSDDDETYDINGNKLSYNEFDDDEDIFQNQTKLKRVISNFTKKQPFTNNADWGGAYVWNVSSNNNFVGTFIYLGDDELLLLNRKQIDDGYEDVVINDIKNGRELYKVFSSLSK